MITSRVVFFICFEAVFYQGHSQCLPLASQNPDGFGITESFPNPSRLLRSLVQFANVIAEEDYDELKEYLPAQAIPIPNEVLLKNRVIIPSDLKNIEEKDDIIANMKDNTEVTNFMGVNRQELRLPIILESKINANQKIIPVELKRIDGTSLNEIPIKRNDYLAANIMTDVNLPKSCLNQARMKQIFGNIILPYKFIDQNNVKIVQDLPRVNVVNEKPSIYLNTVPKALPTVQIPEVLQKYIQKYKYQHPTPINQSWTINPYIIPIKNTETVIVPSLQVKENKISTNNKLVLNPDIYSGPKKCIQNNIFKAKPFNGITTSNSVGPVKSNIVSKTSVQGAIISNKGPECLVSSSIGSNIEPKSSVSPIISSSVKTSAVGPIVSNNISKSTSNPLIPGYNPILTSCQCDIKLENDLKKELQKQRCVLVPPLYL